MQNKVNSLKKKFNEHATAYEKELWAIYLEKFEELKKVVLELANADTNRDYLYEFKNLHCDTPILWRRDCFSLGCELPSFSTHDYSEDYADICYLIHKDEHTDKFTEVEIKVCLVRINESNSYIDFDVDHIDLLKIVDDNELTISSIDYEIQELRSLLAEITAE